MSTEPTDNQADLVPVVIKVDNHKHNGIIIPRGAVIMVDKPTAIWLQQHRIID